MDKTKIQERVVFFIVIILALWGGYQGLYLPSTREIDTIAIQITEEQKKNELLKDISLLQQHLEKYKALSFPSTESTKILDCISVLAKQAGIEIETFQSLEPTDAAMYVELPLQLPFKSSFHRLGKFLSLIESNPQLLCVKKLIVTKPSVIDLTKVAVPTVMLTVSGFYLKESPKSETYTNVSPLP